MAEHLSGNELRKREKRKAIVKGAIKAFQKEGFERASMDLVAECAGASKRTVYNHFESKKDLLWAVVSELMAEQQEAAKQVTYSKEESLESQLRRFADAHIYFVVDPERLSIVRLLTSIFVMNEELRNEADESNHCQPDPLIPWLNAATKDKRLNVKNPELASKVFRGLIEGMINFPALYNSFQTAKQLKPIKEEAITTFLSRYGGRDKGVRGVTQRGQGTDRRHR